MHSSIFPRDELEMLHLHLHLYLSIALLVDTAGHSHHLLLHRVTREEDITNLLRVTKEAVIIHPHRQQADLLQPEVDRVEMVAETIMGDHQTGIILQAMVDLLMTIQMTMREVTLEVTTLTLPDTVGDVVEGVTGMDLRLVDTGNGMTAVTKVNVSKVVMVLATGTLINSSQVAMDIKIIWLGFWTRCAECVKSMFDRVKYSTEQFADLRHRHLHRRQ